eukprot:PhM_4_TR5616/c0_g1_i1/m.27623
MSSNPTFSIVHRKPGEKRIPTQTTLQDGQGAVTRATLPLPGGKCIDVVYGDLTKETTDAIVNAANSKMRHGNGLAKAIVKAGGAIVAKQSEVHVKQHGLVPTSQCVVTEAGALPCKCVIHAVGPIYENNESAAPAELEATMFNVLAAAEQRGLSSVSVPAISSGLFKFPKDLCAHILIGVSEKFLATSASVMCVRMVNFDEETVTFFEREVNSRVG